MDLKWQMAMISMRLKKLYKKTSRKLHFDAKELVGFDKTKFECYNCHKTGHFARECRLKGNQDVRRRDAGNTGYKAKENGRRHGKKEEPKALVTLDVEGIDWTAHAEDEQEDFALMAFSNSCSDTEQNQLWYEEKIRYMKIDLDDKTDVLTYHKKLLAEALKEKDDLKTKFENWQSSSKNLGKLLNTQMSANDKFGLGYGDRFDGILSYENEVLQSVFMNKDSNADDRTLNDRFALTDGITPKVWSDAPIIEEYESDGDDDCVSTPSKEQEQPRESIPENNTSSKSPKVNKKDLNGLKSTRIGLGYGFTKKACYVCGSFSHLIRDYDFQEKRMAKQAELNKRMSKSTSQRDNRPVWNSVQRVNHLNQFVPSVVLTRSGRIPVNTARVSGTNNVNTARQVVPTSAARKVNTVSTDGVKAVSVVGGIGKTVVKASAGLVAFGGSKGQITGKGKIKTGKLDFEDVCFVKELQQFNLFFVSQICNKKNKVLFTDTKCLVLSPDFKLPDENQVLLRVP
ncbi:ribonuclease H-like domain-containing protein [Tanacetum coccineum]